MVTVTMDQIIAFRNADDIFDGTVLPLKVAYKLNKIKKAVSAEGEFYTNKFQEIVDKYAQKDEKGQVILSDDGQQIMIIEDKIEDLKAEIEDIVSNEPYIHKSLLEDADALRQKTKALDQELEEYRKYHEELEKLIENLMQEGGVTIKWELS